MRTPTEYPSTEWNQISQLITESNIEAVKKSKKLHQPYCDCCGMEIKSWEMAAVSRTYHTKICFPCLHEMYVTLLNYAESEKPTANDSMQ